MRMIRNATTWNILRQYTKRETRLSFTEVFDHKFSRQYAKMTTPIVEIKQGKLQGAIRNNIDGGQYFSFRGIPYAEPPIGKLRFKDPEPLKSWSGIRETLEESKCSAQYDSSSDVKEGGDDCLYLDVATTSFDKKRPVMVWIHGGGFKSSSNTYKKYGPDYLLKKEIVFVSINYRLGVLGFLNMEHQECAGNQGLKDQIAALKWVKENVEVFGGDPANVTIFGESAGGASVHALCVSSQAKGLFHKAIMQSGVISNPWAHISSNKEYGYNLAKVLGKDCSNAIETIEFLRTIPALQLVETYENINKMEVPRVTLILVSTPDINNLDPLFPKSHNKNVSDGIDVPVIIGYNSHEGILRFFECNILGLVKELNDNFETVIAEYLRISDIEKASKIAKPVREFYFGKEQINENQIDEIVQFFGDLLFVNNIQDVSDIQMQKTSSTYLYKFSYRPDFPTAKDRFNINIEGTCHADELGCLFFSELRRKRLPDGSRDRIAMERLTTMWTNFAKTGDPTPVIDKLITTKWQPLEKNKKNYLEINDNLTTGENPDIKVWNVWRPLLKSG